MFPLLNVSKLKTMKSSYLLKGYTNFKLLLQLLIHTLFY